MLQHFNRIDVDFDRSAPYRLIARQEREPGIGRQRHDPLIEGMQGCALAGRWRRAIQIGCKSCSPTADTAARQTIIVRT